MSKDFKIKYFKYRKKYNDLKNILENKVGGAESELNETPEENNSSPPEENNSSNPPEVKEDSNLTKNTTNSKETYLESLGLRYKVYK